MSRGRGIVGIGLRTPHIRELLERHPPLAFVEVHSENYLGAEAATLERVRREYPVSLHGVGLSLGSADPLDRAHVAKLDALIRRVDPLLVSEHLSWSAIGASWEGSSQSRPTRSQSQSRQIG